MIPVLAVSNPQAAIRMLRDVFEFREVAPNRLALGDQVIQISAKSDAPKTVIGLPLDHLALAVTDVDDTLERLLARGAELHSGFTPDGPVGIPEFWSNGVRFAFLQGPEGVPIEFCQKLGDERGVGHSHYGLRTPLLDETEHELSANGARPVARHVLAGQPPVEVRFMVRDGEIFELFNETPLGDSTPDRGWIGFTEEKTP